MKKKNIDEIIINGKSLKDILLSHKKWLNEDEDGIRANLRGDNLRHSDLRGADLQDADLETISFNNNTTFSQSQCPKGRVQMSKNYKELSKEKLIEVIQEYSNYVTEYSDSNDINPVCFNEFFQNDYQIFPHSGDIVSIQINLCDDDDFVNWFERKKYENATQFKVVETDYYGTFNIWVEDCPYAINPEIVKIRKKYSY